MHRTIEWLLPVLIGLVILWLLSLATACQAPYKGIGEYQPRGYAVPRAERPKRPPIAPIVKSACDTDRPCIFD